MQILTRESFSQASAKMQPPRYQQRPTFFPKRKRAGPSLVGGSGFAFGQEVALDEADTFQHHREANIATLRWYSESSRNAVRLPFGRSVHLRRNHHYCWANRQTPVLSTQKLVRAFDDCFWSLNVGLKVNRNDPELRV